MNLKLDSRSSMYKKLIILCYNEKKLLGLFKTDTLRDARVLIKEYNELSDVKITRFKNPMTLKEYNVK